MSLSITTENLFTIILILIILVKNEMSTICNVQVKVILKNKMFAEIHSILIDLFSIKSCIIVKYLIDRLVV